jgi:DNA-binding response OmpR family regulator
VIDDEADIAELLTDILSAAGHRVDVAADGAAGLEQIARHPYDLVLTDTKMPVLDGVSLYHELERRYPHLCRRLVFLTGDVLDRHKREFLESIEAPCLTKPFDVPEVRRVVQRMLSGGEPPGGP